MTLEVIQPKLAKNKLNVVGEEHTDYQAETQDKRDGRRNIERKFFRQYYGFNQKQYWKEDEFVRAGGLGPRRGYGDPVPYLVMATIKDVKERFEKYGVRPPFDLKGQIVELYMLKEHLDELIKLTGRLHYTIEQNKCDEIENAAVNAYSKTDSLETILRKVINKTTPKADRLGLIGQVVEAEEEVQEAISSILKFEEEEEDKEEDEEKSLKEMTKDDIDKLRSYSMKRNAEEAGTRGVVGAWKVGEEHVRDMLGFAKKENHEITEFALTGKEEFEQELRQKKFIK